MAKLCDRCGEWPRVSGERFCKDCRKAVLAEIREAGYLTPTQWHSGIARTQEQRENTHETKHGTFHG